MNVSSNLQFFHNNCAEKGQNPGSRDSLPINGYMFYYGTPRIHPTGQKLRPANWCSAPHDADDVLHNRLHSVLPRCDAARCDVGRCHAGREQRRARKQACAFFCRGGKQNNSKQYIQQTNKVNKHDKVLPSRRCTWVPRCCNLASTAPTASYTIL